MALLPRPSSKMLKLEKKPLESSREHSLTFKKEAHPLALLHLMLLLEKTKIAGKSSITSSFDTTISLEGNCFRLTLLTAQFPCRASPTRGVPRSFPLLESTSLTMRTVGATSEGGIRSLVSDGLVRQNSPFYLFPLLTEMVLDWRTFPPCLFA